MARRNGAALVSDDTLHEGQKHTLGKRPSSLNDKPQSSAPKSWRDVLPVHPAAELFPAMSEAELKALGEDIKEHGLLVPITLWTPACAGETVLLDGRNRLTAMELVGLSATEAIKQATLISPNHDPYAYVVSANIHRRHLTAEQKRDLIAKLLKATPEKSNRQIAEMAKVSHPTVAKVRAEKEATGDVERVSTSVDTKGRKQPAKKKKRREADDLKRDIAAKVAAKKAAVPKPLPDKAIPEIVAVDEELAVLREFARFVLGRAKVTTDPKDHAEFKSLLGRVKATLGGEP